MKRVFSRHPRMGLCEAKRHAEPPFSFEFAETSRPTLSTQDLKRRARRRTLRNFRPARTNHGFLDESAKVIV